MNYVGQNVIVNGRDVWMPRRQWQLMNCVERCMDNEQIGREMEIETNTVKTVMTSILIKCGMSGRGKSVSIARIARDNRYE